VFCGESPRLSWVFLWDGWAIGTDSYRADMRAVDCNATGVVNPFGCRAQLWPHESPPPDFEHTLGLARLVGPSSRTVIRSVARHRKDDQCCLGCGTVAPDRWREDRVRTCCAGVPVVRARMLAAAVAGFDEPPLACWDDDRPHHAVHLSGDGHHHVLMPLLQGWDDWELRP
jgi:hypothetical protein